MVEGGPERAPDGWRRARAGLGAPAEGRRAEEGRAAAAGRRPPVVPARKRPARHQPIIPTDATRPRHEPMRFRDGGCDSCDAGAACRRWSGFCRSSSWPRRLPWSWPSAARAAPPSLRVDFIDVGQGDAALVTSPGGKDGPHRRRTGSSRGGVDGVPGGARARPAGPDPAQPPARGSPGRVAGRRAAHRRAAVPGRAGGARRTGLRDADARAGRARDPGAARDARAAHRPRRRRRHHPAWPARAAHQRVSVGRERQQRGRAADVRVGLDALRGRRRGADRSLVARLGRGPPGGRPQGRASRQPLCLGGAVPAGGSAARRGDQRRRGQRIRPPGSDHAGAPGAARACPFTGPTSTATSRSRRTAPRSACERRAPRPRCRPRHDEAGQTEPNTTDPSLLFVDAIEADTARLVGAGGVAFTVPARLLPAGAKEGSWLRAAFVLTDAPPDDAAEIRRTLGPGRRRGRHQALGRLRSRRAGIRVSLNGGGGLDDGGGDARGSSRCVAAASLALGCACSSGGRTATGGPRHDEADGGAFPSGPEPDGGARTDDLHAAARRVRTLHRQLRRLVVGCAGPGPEGRPGDRPPRQREADPRRRPAAAGRRRSERPER